jgi:hypothetical protein
MIQKKNTHNRAHDSRRVWDSLYNMFLMTKMADAVWVESFLGVPFLSGKQLVEPKSQSQSARLRTTSNTCRVAEMLSISTPAKDLRRSYRELGDTLTTTFIVTLDMSSGSFRPDSAACDV